MSSKSQLQAINEIINIDEVIATNYGSTELAMQNRIAKPSNDCCEAVCSK